MRLVEPGVGKEHVVGGDERQGVGVGEGDERRLDPVLQAAARGASARHRAARERARRGGTASPRPLRSWPSASSRPTGPRGPPVRSSSPSVGPSSAASATCGSSPPSVSRKDRLTSLQKVAIAGLVLHQQHDRVGRGCLARFVPRLGLAIAAPQRQFAADDRLDPRRRARPARIRARRRDCHDRSSPPPAWRGACASATSAFTLIAPDDSE